MIGCRSSYSHSKHRFRRNELFSSSSDLGTFECYLVATFWVHGYWGASCSFKIVDPSSFKEGKHLYSFGSHLFTSVAGIQFDPGCLLGLLLKSRRILPPCLRVSLMRKVFVLSPNWFCADMNFSVGSVKTHTWEYPSMH